MIGCNFALETETNPATGRAVLAGFEYRKNFWVFRQKEITYDGILSDAKFEFSHRGFYLLFFVTRKLIYRPVA